MKKMTYKQLERIAKGFANHRRVQIMELLKQSPELSVEEIAKTLDVNFKTISEHTRRLAISGLVLKRYEVHSVRHKLSPRGVQVLKFLRTLE